MNPTCRRILGLARPLIPDWFKGMSLVPPGLEIRREHIRRLPRLRLVNVAFSMNARPGCRRSSSLDLDRADGGEADSQKVVLRPLRRPCCRGVPEKRFPLVLLLASPWGLGPHRPFSNCCRVGSCMLASVGLCPSSIVALVQMTTNPPAFPSSTYASLQPPLRTRSSCILTSCSFPASHLLAFCSLVASAHRLQQLHDSRVIFHPSWKPY